MPHISPKFKESLPGVLIALALFGIFFASITLAAIPARRPILNFPPPNATSSLRTNNVFKMSASDPDSADVMYKRTIYKNEACTQVAQTNDETASQTGWSGQNASSNLTYAVDSASGTSGVFTLQS